MGAIGTIASILTAAVGIGSSVYSMTQRPDKPKPVIPQQESEAQKAAAAQMELMRKRRGASSTLLTGQQGITTPPTVLKTTLGG